MWVSSTSRAAAGAERGEIAGAHGFADAVRHETGGFEGDSEGAVKLIGADALLAGDDEVNRLKPDMQRDVAALEDGADLDGEGLAALVTPVGTDPGRPAAHFTCAVNAATMRTDRAVRPNALFHER
jgi:hypothetical protein